MFLLFHSCQHESNPQMETMLQLCYFQDHESLLPSTSGRFVLLMPVAEVLEEIQMNQETHATLSTTDKICDERQDNK